MYESGGLLKLERHVRRCRNIMSNSENFLDLSESVNPFLYSPSSVYLKTFPDMWYKIFLTALFSSVFIHTIAALIAFATLRKHKFGKFFPIFILIMGVIPPLTSGVISSAAIAFVYRASSLPMLPVYALLWGLGQTAVAACIGFTRILATL